MVTQTDGSPLTGLVGAQDDSANSEVEEPKASDTTEEQKQADETTLDYKALYQQEKEAREKVNADLQTERGRLRARDKAPAWAEELRRENRAIRNRLDLMPDLIEGNAADPQAPRRRLQEMTQEEQRTVVLDRARQRTETWSNRVQAKADKLELNLHSDPRTREVVTRWNAAAARGDADVVEEAYNDLTDLLEGITEETRDQRRDGAQRERVNEDRQNGKLRTDSGRTGGGGAASEQDLVNRYSRGEDMSVTDMAKASAALDKGILPKVKV